MTQALMIKDANGSFPAIPIPSSPEIARNSSSSDLRYSSGNLLLTKMLREGLAELESHRDRMLTELSEWSDQMRLEMERNFEACENQLQHLQNEAQDQQDQIKYVENHIQKIQIRNENLQNQLQILKQTRRGCGCILC